MCLPLMDAWCSVHNVWRCWICLGGHSGNNTLRGWPREGGWIISNLVCGQSAQKFLDDTNCSDEEAFLCCSQ